MKTTAERNRITGQIVDAAMRVHTKLGPGLLESAYEACLKLSGHKVGLLINFNVARLKDGIN